MVKPRVLITGGTGTIGTTLIEHFYDKWEITVLSRDEYKQSILTHKYPAVKFVLGDVRNAEDITRALNYGYYSDEKFSIIIHAAAMKRIEMCEKHPYEAIKTNVLGAQNVITIAKQREIRNVIAISTDKAVEPVNTYGMTKALQEKLFVEAGFKVVRYGNVFGSRGSVAEVWLNASVNNNPIQITNPKMTRFVLTPLEALELIEFGIKWEKYGEFIGYPNGGGIIITRPCPSVTAQDLADCFMERTKQEVVGVRGGEKLHEMLVSQEETTRCRGIIYNDTNYFIIEAKEFKGYDKPYTSENNYWKLTAKETEDMVSDWILGRMK